ncbi:MAG TPA: hypothetical protein VGQ64_00285, partial [Candidatus Limnocylindrales bacterium]|nr:hypothetical protein [Candidatus Limnocylindrales bacterium]
WPQSEQVNVLSVVVVNMKKLHLVRPQRTCLAETIERSDRVAALLVIRRSSRRRMRSLAALAPHGERLF